MVGLGIYLVLNMISRFCIYLRKNSHLAISFFLFSSQSSNQAWILHILVKTGLVSINHYIGYYDNSVTIVQWQISHYLGIFSNKIDFRYCGVAQSSKIRRKMQFEKAKWTFKFLLKQSSPEWAYRMMKNFKERWFFDICNRSTTHTHAHKHLLL